MPRRQTRLIPTSRRRYPNDMAVARQSEADQSVNGGRLPAPGEPIAAQIGQGGGLSAGCC